MGFALKTCQTLPVIRELKMHDFDRVDTVILGVACDIDSRKTASPELINEFVTTLDDTSYHVTTHESRSFSMAIPRGYYTSFKRECHDHVLCLCPIISVKRLRLVNGSLHGPAFLSKLGSSRDAAPLLHDRQWQRRRSDTASRPNGLGDSRRTPSV